MSHSLLLVSTEGPPPEWILDDWRHSEPWDEPHMQENTDWAGVCRSSEVTTQVIKDAALYAIFPGLVSFLQSVGVWSHSWFRAWWWWLWGVWVCVGCSCILVWILSSSGLLNQREQEYPSINTFLSPEKLMAVERSGVAERVQSTAITVSFCGWLNYNLWFINSSWRCQRRRGTEVSLWQHWNLEECFVSTNLKPPSKQLHFLKSPMKGSAQLCCCSTWHWFHVIRWNSCVTALGNGIKAAMITWLINLLVDKKLICNIWWFQLLKCDNLLICLVLQDKWIKYCWFLGHCSDKTFDDSVTDQAINQKNNHQFNHIRSCSLRVTYSASLTYVAHHKEPRIKC